MRLDPFYGWPLRGPDAPEPEDEGALSDGLRQELLDWSESWYRSADAEGVFDDEAAEAEHVRRGLGLQKRVQRELDRPVAFLES